MSYPKLNLEELVKTKNIFLSLLLFFAVSEFSVAQKQSGSKISGKKVVFIAGPDSHGKGEHEYNGGVTFLAQKLKEGLPEIDTLVFHKSWPTDPDALDGVATIVLFCDGSEGHMITPHLKELEKQMNGGTGLVMIHYTLEMPKGNEADQFRNLIGGYFEMNWSVNPFWSPEFKTLPKHPITNGVKPFSIRDEWYYHMRFVENQKYISPILQVLPPDSTLSRPDGTHSNNAFVREAVITKKLPQTLAWAFNRPGGGRGFGFSGGHVHANWKNDSFRMLVLNAIAWTAHMTVPQEGIRTTTPSAEMLQKLERPAR